MIFFSVVIPVYNGSKKISNALDSLKHQSESDFEVIIVDDCSEDFEDLKIEVNKFSTLNIKLIRHEINKNGAAARNTGVENASGIYIAYLDADDYWDVNKLKFYKERLSSLDNTSNVILYSKIKVLKPSGHELIRPDRKLGCDEHVSDYLFVSKQLIQTSTIVLAREMALKIRFDERFIRHQDYDFVLRAQQVFNCEFIMINESLTIYSSSDFALKRSLHLGETSDFSKYWLSEMSGFMTSNAILNYKFFFLLPKLRMERKIMESIFILIASIVRMENRKEVIERVMNFLIK